jgi:hypothetical protein
MIKKLQIGLWIFVILLASSMGGELGDRQLPPFGRDTVLVWKIQNLNYQSQFVARIADFSPDRYLEWEDASSQGTVFMAARDVLTAKNYVSTSLFQSGVDSKSKKATTLWLSRLIYQELKKKGKVKCSLDSVQALLTYAGEGQLAVEVNKSTRELPVIKVKDDRGAEWWFLDNEENPLLMKNSERNYSQTLASITTNRANTLRWIKGSKLNNPPR